MRRVVSWCLGRRSVVILATALVFVAGAYGATQLRQQFFPDANLPFLLVTTQAPGLDAKQVDDQIAVPLERAARNLDAVDQTRTSANEGRAQLVVQLAYGTDTKAFKKDLASELDSVQLPPQAEAPRMQSGFSDRAIMNVALSTQGSLPALTKRAEDLQKEIEAVPGVQRVDLEGGQKPQYRVHLKRRALERGMTPASLAAALRPQVDGTALGLVERSGTSTPLRVRPSSVRSVRDLERLRVGDGRRLEDVADVQRAPDPGEGFARANGRPSVSLAVYKQDRADEVGAIRGAERALDRARDEIGPRNVTVVTETGSQIEKSINGLLLEGGLGALFAIVVIFLFLRTVRATAVAAVSIPTSVVFGLFAGWALGLTLNIITLAGLTIAVGRVIDDAIVVLENIWKHLERGDPRFKAAVDGTTEVASAIVSSTLATAAVFLPLALVGGLISEIFFSFSVIVVVALLASLLVSVTVIPVLATLLLRPRAADAKATEGGALGRAVAPVTRAGIRARWLVVPVAVVLFLGTLVAAAAGAVPVQFLPDSGTQQVYGRADLPGGTGAERASELLAPLERRIGSLGGVRNYQVSFGGEAMRMNPNNSGPGADFFINFAPGADVAGAVSEIRSFGTRTYPEGFQVQRIEQGPPSGAFEAIVRGDDLGAVRRDATRVVGVLERRPDVIEVRSDAEREQTQYALDVKRRWQGTAEAARAEQTLAALTSSAEAGTAAGDIPVVVSVPDRLLRDPDALERLPLASTAPGTPAGMGGTGAGGPAATGGSGAGGPPGAGAGTGTGAPGAGASGGAAGSPGGAAGAAGGGGGPRGGAGGAGEQGGSAVPPGGNAPSGAGTAGAPSAPGARTRGASAPPSAPSAVILSAATSSSRGRQCLTSDGRHASCAQCGRAAERGAPCIDDASRAVAGRASAGGGAARAGPVSAGAEAGGPPAGRAHGGAGGSAGGGPGGSPSGAGAPARAAGAPAGAAGAVPAGAVPPGAMGAGAAGIPPGAGMPAGAAGMAAGAMPSGVPGASAGTPSGASRRGPKTVGQVGRVVRERTPAVLTRVDGDYAATINARITARDTNGVIEAIKADVRRLDLRDSRVEYGGDSKFISQMFSDLSLAMLVAIALVFLVLVVFFGSVAQPLTILAPILFSTIGSLGALVLTNQALGLPAMIGQLLLIGIVVANSVLLVDTALRLRRGGLPREESLVGSARLRVRPVLMTAIATIAALFPLAAGLSGEGGIISRSLGSVVIGGLLTATLLTLVIVPAVFTTLDHGRRRAAPGGLGPGPDGDADGAAPAERRDGSHEVTEPFAPVGGNGGNGGRLLDRLRGRTRR
jgi:multidrug efflux pump subunit AcrB